MLYEVSADSYRVLIALRGVRCVQSSATNFGTSCVCRVPRKDLEEGKVSSTRLIT